MLAVIIIAQTITWLVFRQDRERRLAQQFSETKIAQIQGIRTALAAAPRGQRPGPIPQLAKDYNAYIVPVERRPEIGLAPRGPRFAQVVEQLRKEFGEQTEVRLGMRDGVPVVWTRLTAGGEAYWVGLPVERSSENFPVQIAAVVAALLSVLLAAAYWFARRAAAPLKLLATAAQKTGLGQPIERIPETGPAEIAAVARGFNQMRDNLAQIENERALMLAGVSHDIRTPLTRLKLELEMAGLADETKSAMTLDLEEIERTVGQFLDFARFGEKQEMATFSADDWLSARAERERVRAGKHVQLEVAGAISIYGHAPSLDRAVSNLIENAFRYGSNEILIRATINADRAIEIEVADRGSGIAEQDVQRMLRPFTRGNEARTDASGAGLGLAIVERIARLHGGSLALLPRNGGGTRAIITIPAAQI